MVDLMDSTPVVSISCLAYNHAPYIRECLDGFLNQKTTFSFEVLIHDDCSTDGTTDIIREYASLYPEIIKPMYETENQYQNGKPAGSLVWNVPRAKGKYIAICEGDDYWTDSLKLQKQVDFLEANPDYGMCYTTAMRYHQADGRIQDIWGGDYERFEQMITKNTVPTLTALLRYDILLKYLKTAYRDSNWLMGDYPMWLWLAAESKIKFIDEVTATYRILPESASHSLLLKKTWGFTNSFFCIQKYYIRTYHNILSDDCVQAVYCKAYRRLLPGAIALGNVDFVKEAGLFMTVHNLPPLVVAIYKFRHIFKPILIMWYRLRGLRL